MVWAKEAALINTLQFATRPFQTLWMDNGTTLSASSTGASAGKGRLLIGAVFSDHFLDCDMEGMLVDTPRRAPARHSHDEDEL